MRVSVRSKQAVMVLAAAVSMGCQAPLPDAAGREAIRTRAQAAYDAKRFDECARLYRQIALPRADPHLDRYSAAGCLARANRRDQALKELQTAARGGYRYFRQLERDEDLAGLRDDPRWSPLVLEVRGNDARYQAALNPELRTLYEQDQADRRGGLDQKHWDAIARRDVARMARVRQILTEGGAKLGGDYHHAAMVMQHGETLEDIRFAHALTLKGLELEPVHPLILWLAAASRDRELMMMGKPQLYGTQFNRSADGKVERWKVDPSITNAERARWHVDPIPGAP